MTRRQILARLIVSHALMPDLLLDATLKEYQPAVMRRRIRLIVKRKVQISWRVIFAAMRERFRRYTHPCSILGCAVLG